MNSLDVKQMIQNLLVRVRQVVHNLVPKGKYVIEHYRQGKLIGTYNINNDIVNQGKNDLLEVYFHSGTQTLSPNWYIGLISLTGYVGLAPGDTLPSKGWTEFTGYSEANRPAWGPTAAASQSITNPTPVQFTINAPGTVKGVFVANDAVKGGTGGKLWATALFSGDVPVSSGDQLKITYTLSC